MTDDQVTLPIDCPKCGQPVTLMYTETQHLQKVWWNCPYVDCRTEHQMILRTSAVKAVAGYEPPRSA